MPIITISGPSGAGKTSLLEMMVKDKEFVLLPSWTSRKKRNENIASDIYTYLSRDEYAEKLKSDFFLLSDEVAGNMYGTAKRDIETAVVDTRFWLADFTAQSTLDLMDIGYPPRGVIFLDIDKETSSKRMTKRGDSLGEIKKRLNRYNSEIQLANIALEKFENCIKIDGTQEMNAILTGAKTFCHELPKRAPSNNRKGIHRNG